ncbi:MAG: acyl-CoA dehydrogenase family protein [Holophagaceae bacterium]
MYSKDQLTIKDLARSFAQNEVEPEAARRDRESLFPTSLLRKLGEIGFMGMLVPEQYGGSGLDFMSYLLALEEIAYSDASLAVAMSVNNSVVCGPLLTHGSEEQKMKYLPDLCNGKALGAFMLSEPNAGSDASALQTKATKTEGGWILNGSKAWITNGAFAKYFIVIAVTNPSAGKKGISAFIIDSTQKGLLIAPAEKKMGLRSSNTVMVTLQDVFVPKENLLGAEGAGLKVALGGLDGGRVGIAAQALGMAQRALDESIKYSKERITFGKRIGEHQSIATYLAEMETRVQASRLLINRAASKIMSLQKATLESATAKLFTTENAVWICDKAVQIHGGYGYTSDYVVERLYRDVRVTTIYEGTSEIQRIVVTRELLGQ